MSPAAVAHRQSGRHYGCLACQKSTVAALYMGYSFMLWWSLGLSMIFCLNLPQHTVELATIGHIFTVKISQRQNGSSK